MALETTDDAFALMVSLHADKILIKHSELVFEVAQSVLINLQEKHITVDHHVVEMGAILHDIGKVICVNELHEPGNVHEAVGEKLLLERGVDEKIAEICRTHANWDETTLFEGLIVALSDKLWKGKRDSQLEELVIRRCAKALGLETHWDIFINLDTFFEEIASNGLARLARSRS